MEGLESPRENGEALMQFDGESDGGGQMIDQLHPKVYFYTEASQLETKIFPQEWFVLMSKETSEEIQPKEPPFFIVSLAFDSIGWIV